VKIDIHQQLYKWRQVITEEGQAKASKAAGMKLMTVVLSRPGLYRFAGKAARWVLRTMPGLVNNRFNPWYKQRELPAPPAESFSTWYKKNR